MKIRTLILMAIVVILAGCSGSILQGSTDTNLPDKFKNTSWTGTDYNMVFSSAGYTITRNSDSGRITNTSRYKGTAINVTNPDENTVRIEIRNNYDDNTGDPIIDEFIISEESGSETLSIKMQNVYLDGTRDKIDDIGTTLTKVN